jgi:acetoacetyl-[acyl-carrier protein] synthase
LPGISTIDRLADDVVSDRLDFSLAHRRLDPAAQRYAVVNSKGFGGNNASAALLSPAVTQRMLQARYGAREWQAWQARNEQVEAARRDYDEAVTAGRVKPVYRFDHGVLGDEDVALKASSLRVGDYEIALDLRNPWDDMTPGD